MSNYLIAQTIGCLSLVLLGLLMVWRYHVCVGRPAKLRDFQYRLFALRDQAVDLLVDGVTTEDDPRWESLYKHLNDSAKATSVGRMKNGLSFVLSLLRHATPPTQEEAQEFRSLPRPMRELWGKYVQTVLGICWEGSLILRTCVKLATHFTSFKRWLERQKPEEAARYRRFWHSGRRLASTTCT